MEYLKTKSNKEAVIIVSAILIFVAGWYGHKFSVAREGDSYTGMVNIVREDSTRYQFTNPLLFIDNGAAVFSDLDPLKNGMENSIQKSIASGSASDVAVYFRDLNTTRWTGVNEDSLYDPASMHKVTLLITYLHAVDSDPEVISEELYYEGDTDKDSFYYTRPDLEKGKRYSTRDLLIDMIIKSGNDSTAVLFENIDKTQLARVYEDLNFPFPSANKPELISPKVYSRLFRVLYSSTYLDRSLSEQALSLLSQTEFDKGLRDPLPKTLRVAHKFGERTSKYGAGEPRHQLHDCGIIYYPDHPYFLCVMSKGEDFAKLQNVISDISKITYQYWNSLW